MNTTIEHKPTHIDHPMLMLVLGRAPGIGEREREQAFRDRLAAHFRGVLRERREARKGAK
jgi:uracil-DNA glycosylase